MVKILRYLGPRIDKFDPWTCCTRSCSSPSHIQSFQWTISAAKKKN